MRPEGTGSPPRQGAKSGEKRPEGAPVSGLGTCWSDFADGSSELSDFVWTIESRPGLTLPT